MDTTIVFRQSAFKHGVSEADIRRAFKTPELTEEEADALDEYYTVHVPKTGPNGTGFISRRNARLLGLDNLTMDYLRSKAEADHKSPAQIIGELVREKIAAASV